MFNSVSHLSRYTVGFYMLKPGLAGALDLQEIKFQTFYPQIH